MSATPEQLRHPEFAPDIILEDILLPLPVKSLKRFQGVSKTWKAFISHPYFVQKHLRYLKSNTDTDRLNLLLETKPLRSICTSLKNLREDNGAPIATRELAYPEMTPTSSVVIFGSVNGLICLEFDKTDIVIWNPCTGESKLLPQNTIVDRAPDHASDFYGFGYDSKSEDYKVMRGNFEVEGSSEDEMPQYPKTIVEVFSLKNGSWRMQTGYSESAIEGQGCLVNETLHWVDYNGHAPIVRSFDLGEEKFLDNIECLCSIIRAQSSFIGGVLNIKNHIAVYSLTVDDVNEYKIWMLRNGEQGHGSWTEIGNVISDRFLTPIWYSESGEVLAIVGETLAWYNPKDKRFTKATETLDYSFGATAYIETLVPPLTGNVAVSAGESGMTASTPEEEDVKEEVAATTNGTS